MSTTRKRPKQLFHLTPTGSRSLCGSHFSASRYTTTDPTLTTCPICIRLYSIIHYSTNTLYPTCKPNGSRYRLLRLTDDPALVTCQRCILHLQKKHHSHNRLDSSLFSRHYVHSYDDLSPLCDTDEPGFARTTDPILTTCKTCLSLFSLTYSPTHNKGKSL